MTAEKWVVPDPIQYENVAARNFTDVLSRFNDL
jgi:hypothetical protein